MTQIQRMQSDFATMDRRGVTDQLTLLNRTRNDELTAGRRLKADYKAHRPAGRSLKNQRSKNDEVTREKRVKEDRVLVGNRVRNDENTMHRREMMDDS